MYHVVNTPPWRCSKCGAGDHRIFHRHTLDGRSYQECADCGHSNKPPEITANSSGYSMYTLPSPPPFQEFLP